jgi:hypothetical protein
MFTIIGEFVSRQSGLTEYVFIDSRTGRIVKDAKRYAESQSVRYFCDSEIQAAEWLRANGQYYREHGNENQ